MEKLKVYYFGNEYVKEDSFAIEVANKLKEDVEMQEVDFIHVKDTFQLMDLELEGTLLLDVVKSIKKIRVFEAEDVKSVGASTTHDFDLGFFLKLTGKTASIIGLPMEYDLDLAVSEVKKILLAHLQTN